MKKSMVILLVGLFIIAGVLTKEANASWVAFSTDEIIEKSDVILIGEIVGPVGEEKRAIQGLSDYWVTHWKVKVYYYLKGNQDTEEFTVTTPGAENKWIQSSLDYRIDQFGKTVLLFLHEQEGIFVPLSPQGVVVMEKSDYSPKQDEQINGQTVLEQFAIVNPQINNSSKLEKYLAENKTVIIPKPGTKDSYLNLKRSNQTRVITVALVTSASIIIGLLFVIKKR